MCLLWLTGPHTTNEHTVQKWFKRFRSGKHSFKDQVHGNQPSALDNDKLNILVKSDPLTVYRELAKELCDISNSFKISQSNWKNEKN